MGRSVGSEPVVRQKHRSQIRRIRMKKAMFETVLGLGPQHFFIAEESNAQYGQWLVIYSMFNISFKQIRATMSSVLCIFLSSCCLDEKPIAVSWNGHPQVSWGSASSLFDIWLKTHIPFCSKSFEMCSPSPLNEWPLMTTSWVCGGIWSRNPECSPTRTRAVEEEPTKGLGPPLYSATSFLPSKKMQNSQIEGQHVFFIIATRRLLSVWRLNAVPSKGLRVEL